MVRKFGVKLALLSQRQRAQAMVEYALILVLVAIVVIVALTALGGGISNTFNVIIAKLK